MKARIALFAHDLAANGVARNAIAVARGLAAAGHATDLLVARGDGRFAAESPGAARIVPLTAREGRRARELWSTARALRGYLSAHAPALFVSMGNHGHADAWLGSRGFRGKRAYRISNDLQRAMPGAPLDRLGAWRRSRIASLLARDADQLWLVSPALRATAAFAEAARAGRVRVIPNGVDLARAAELARLDCPHPWLEGGPPVVLAIGRFHPQKNFAALLRAFALLRRTRPARLVILGDGPARERALLERRASELGVAADVALPGIAHNPYAYLSRAAAFALPSWWEGSSNALLEALACGTAVAASRSAGDAAHVLGDGKYGVLFDPSDDREIARALLLQISDAAVRAGDRARDFALRRTLERIESCVSELIAPRQAAPAPSGADAAGVA